MKNQVVYESNLDFEATHDSLISSKQLVVEQTPKGLITAKFIGTETMFLISPKGKIQVLWNNPQEKKLLLDRLKNLLVPKEGTIWTKATRQQVIVQYPPPPRFKLYWCAEETEYIEKSEVKPVTLQPITMIMNNSKKKPKPLWDWNDKDFDRLFGFG